MEIALLCPSLFISIVTVPENNTVINTCRLLKAEGCTGMKYIAKHYNILSCHRNQTGMHMQELGVRGNYEASVLYINCKMSTIQ